MVSQKETHYGRIDFSINSKLYNNTNANAMLPQDTLQYKKEEAWQQKIQIWVGVLMSQ